MTSPLEPFTPFLPTTFDVPEEQDRMRTFLVDRFANMGDVINAKKIGAYSPAENQNGESWFFDTTQRVRNGFQAIIRITNYNFVLKSYPLPYGTATAQFAVTLVYGSASKKASFYGAGDGDYFSYFSNGDTRIQLQLKDNELVVLTNGAMAAYSGFVIIHYLKDGN